MLSPANHLNATVLNEAERLKEVIHLFEALFAETHRVRLRGGFSEPFYRAPTLDREGEIQFRGDYLSSCLHEIAHWLVAGEVRRNQDDFGYGYVPDGRNAQEQKIFFASEIKPQAMESALAKASGTHFRLSVDNLADGAENAEEVQEFGMAVTKQRENWEQNGFPLRAQRLLSALRSAFQSD